MQADLYHNRLLKPVKQFFLCRTLYTCGVPEIRGKVPENSHHCSKLNDISC